MTSMSPSGSNPARRSRSLSRYTHAPRCRPVCQVRTHRYDASSTEMGWGFAMVRPPEGVHPDEVVGPGRTARRTPRSCCRANEGPGRTSGTLGGGSRSPVSRNGSMCRGAAVRGRVPCTGSSVPPPAVDTDRLMLLLREADGALHRARGFGGHDGGHRPEPMQGDAFGPLVRRDGHVPAHVGLQHVIVVQVLPMPIPSAGRDGPPYGRLGVVGRLDGGEPFPVDVPDTIDLSHGRGEGVGNLNTFGANGGPGPGHLRHTFIREPPTHPVPFSPLIPRKQGSYRHRAMSHRGKAHGRNRKAERVRGKRERDFGRGDRPLGEGFGRGAGAPTREQEPVLWGAVPLPPGGLRGPEGGETPGGEGVKVVFSCGCVFTREKDPYTGRVEYTRDGC